MPTFTSQIDPYYQQRQLNRLNQAMGMMAGVMNQKRARKQQRSMDLWKLKMGLIGDNTQLAMGPLGDELIAMDDEFPGTAAIVEESRTRGGKEAAGLQVMRNIGSHVESDREAWSGAVDTVQGRSTMEPWGPPHEGQFEMQMSPELEAEKQADLESLGTNFNVARSAQEYVNELSFNENMALAYFGATNPEYESVIPEIPLVDVSEIPQSDRAIMGAVRGDYGAEESYAILQARGLTEEPPPGDVALEQIKTDRELQSIEARATAREDTQAHERSMEEGRMKRAEMVREVALRVKAGEPGAIAEYYDKVIDDEYKTRDDRRKIAVDHAMAQPAPEAPKGRGRTGATSRIGARARKKDRGALEDVWDQNNPPPTFEKMALEDLQELEAQIRAMWAVPSKRDALFDIGAFSEDAAVGQALAMYTKYIRELGLTPDEAVAKVLNRPAPKGQE